MGNLCSPAWCAIHGFVLIEEKQLCWLNPDSKMVPLVLLPFACLVFISTATCMYEMIHWDVPLKQRLNLMMLYGPYTALRKYLSLLLSSRRGKWSLRVWQANEWFEAAFIGTDMFLRLKAMITSSVTPALEASGKKNLWVNSGSSYLSNRRVMSAQKSSQDVRQRGELCRLGL